MKTKAEDDLKDLIQISSPTMAMDVNGNFVGLHFPE